MQKKILLFLLVIILFITGNVFGQDSYFGNISAKVVDVESEYVRDLVVDFENDEKLKERVQNIKVEILEDEYKGRTYQIENIISSTDKNVTAFNRLKKGDKIYVLAQEIDGEVRVVMNGTQRNYAIYALIAIFIISIIAVAGVKGIKTVIALILTILIIFTITIPYILKGYNPYITSIISCTVISIISFCIISGFNRKTLSAILGTTGGVLVAGLFTIVFGYLTRISGRNEETIFLSFIEGGNGLDLIAIMFAGILIGSIGAAMDVAMSIASSLSEIKSKTPDISKSSLMKSGMNIGKDIMGTMANTLILAYVGSSITAILLYTGYKLSINEILNIETITEEVIRSISGSLGLITVVPITSYISSILYGKKES